MQNHRKILTLVMVLAIPMTASVATISTAIIDYSKTGSFSLYKYDMTRASDDGVWDTSSYISTGIFDSYLYDLLYQGLFHEISCVSQKNASSPYFIYFCIRR